MLTVVTDTTRKPKKDTDRDKPMGAIADRLAPLYADLTAARQSGDAEAIRTARRALYRAVSKELVAAAPAQITRGIWTLTFVQGPRVTVVKGVPMLEMRVRLRRNGVNVPIDPHLRFVNPPFRVPDGGVDGDGNPTYAENPAAALRQMVLDALAVQVAELRG